jgi:hypothetical protein
MQESPVTPSIFQKEVLAFAVDVFKHPFVLVAPFHRVSITSAPQDRRAADFAVRIVEECLVLVQKGLMVVQETL